MRRMVIVGLVLMMGLVLARTPPVVAALPRYFVGVRSDGPVGAVQADIETPVWGPTVTGGGWVYDWVMVQNPAGVNPFLAQIGWMAAPGRAPVVAAYAWVGGPGGWEDYREFPQVTLVRGRRTHYEVAHVGANWWALSADGLELVRYNLPSGPAALPQAYLESLGDNAIPDVATAATGLDSCWLQADAPYAMVAGSCVGFYARR